MSVNPDRSAKVREDSNKPAKVTQWGRQLFSITGWLILLMAIVLALRPIATPAPLDIKANTTLPASAIVDRPNPHNGPLDAPVTIVEFGDFSCPACGVWNESGTIERVIDKYGDQVRFVWADFPSVSSDSSKAAEAARCAYDQGKFWEYHDYLYSHMEVLGINDLKVYANLLGLNQTQFDQCLDTGARAAEVNNDFRDAVKRHVGVLPTFYIQSALGEMRLVGPPSYELLVSVIDPILARKP
jgi:protein-disulfide isomerase